MHNESDPTTTRDVAVPKILGRDAELSTTGIDPDGRAMDPYDVAAAILEQIEPTLAEHDVRTWRPYEDRQIGEASRWAASSRDTLRNWAGNGQCFYCDLGHVELCTAEALSPRDFAAQSFAALQIVEEARKRAEALAPVGTRLSLTTANLDVKYSDIAWGTHVNVAIGDKLWEGLLRNGGRYAEDADPATRAYVAGALAAAVPFFGTGAVLMDSEGPLYALSGRSAHITRLVSTSTTEAFQRGLLNTRREPHAGAKIDRLHLIAFDHALASSALLGSYLQVVLAAAEMGLDRGPFLRRPVAAQWAWSIQMDLKAVGDVGTVGSTGKAVLPLTWPTSDGRARTLPQFIRDVVEPLIELCEEGVIGEDVAPEARDLLPRIVELTHYLDRGELQPCAPHLDWVLKLVCLRDVCERHGLTFGNGATRALDHDFGNTNPAVGPFFAMWNAGNVDALVSKNDVERFLQVGPGNTRAWIRGQLVQRFHDVVTDVNWSYVELLRGSARWMPRVRIALDLPHGHDRASYETLIASSHNVEELVQKLRADNAAMVRTTDPAADVRRRFREATRSTD